MVLTKVSQGFKRFGEFIASIVNNSLLVIVYLIGVGLTSILAKIFGKHFLEMDKKGHTYWTMRDAESKDINDYYRQF